MLLRTFHQPTKVQDKPFHNALLFFGGITFTNFIILTQTTNKKRDYAAIGMARGAFQICNLRQGKARQDIVRKDIFLESRVLTNFISYHSLVNQTNPPLHSAKNSRHASLPCTDSVASSTQPRRLSRPKMSGRDEANNVTKELKPSMGLNSILVSYF